MGRLGRSWPASDVGMNDMIHPILEGTKVKGVGAASDPRNPYALPALLPIFEQQFDELRGAYRGTINVDVHKPIDLKIDFRTRPYRFGQEVHCVEFVRILFEYPCGAMHNSWIYQPYGYHWGEKDRQSIVEVLVSNHVGNIAVGDKCRLHILNNNRGETSTSAHYLRRHGIRKIGGRESSLRDSTEPREW
jgi:hypothetical protein